MRKLHLDTLKSGLPGISAIAGSFYAEAAAYCLNVQGHKTGVAIVVSGDFDEIFELHWTGELNEQTIQTWQDQEEATEYGAMGIALLLILALTNFTVAGRLSKGGRTDFVLKNRGQSSKLKAKLEVSGIWKETSSNSVGARLNLKKKQVKGGFEGFPIYISIIEFCTPKANMINV